MKKEEKEHPQLDNSQYRLRKTIGILGIALPLLLLLNHEELLPSMSHYYYTTAGVFFISILSAFGLILLTYQGYAREEGEFLSDNAITTMAAVCIFITVLVPTKADGYMCPVQLMEPNRYLFGHENPIHGAIHLISAGLFLCLLGYMCFAKFTMSPAISPIKKQYYKISAYIIWASVAALIIMFSIEKIAKIDLNNYWPAYVFWLELIAVWAFGIAWLVKGRFDRDIQALVGKAQQE